MPQPDIKSQGTQPPPYTGHPLPRRTSPEKSVTLRHHRLARDGSLRASAGSVPPNATTAASTRRNSSGESHDTGHSDPMKWFDRSNQNPTATFDNSTMDVDPPFFQRETDSSNEDKLYPMETVHAPPKLTTAQSSSADDYRSVIDDLTVEIHRLKDELKRYKQKGPDMLRKEKLFEIKVHGLPKRKKRELEITLRDFAASLEGSPDASSSQQNKTSRHNQRDRMYSGSGTRSKHASSSSGSNARPADSAYASMSTGAHSSGPSLGRPSLNSSRARTSEQKVESYLRDIPEGLYPRHVIMTEKEKKKLVVRRLEQLFTGRIGGRQVRRQQTQSNIPGAAPLAPVMAEVQSQGQRPMVHQPPTLGGVTEPAREARILPPEQQSSASRKKSRSRDNGSASNSGGDQTESGGNGNSSGGTNPSPTAPPPPEQRPTRPKDLDPDRQQNPTENMKYIRHLGLVPPELIEDPYKVSQEGHDDSIQNTVHADADGWVYLNLLCNLAQLHIINVTPDFVRSAVSGISTKFQLSPDGRKIRWRGGVEGTKFSSDSSGENSHPSPEVDAVDVPNKREARKRQKTGHSTGDEFQSGSSSKDQSKFGQQFSGSSESFHYKPLFVHQDSSGGNTSMDGTLSSFGPVEDSNVDDSRWGQSGSGGDSNRRKRRHDGAIIYYSGAPFCTDLSGDPGDISPTTYMLSSGQDQRGSEQSQQSLEAKFARPPPPPRRSESGSVLNYRPLSDTYPFSSSSSKMDVDSSPGLTTDEGEMTDLDLDMHWSNEQQFLEVLPLEPCGLGGVLPDDHFMVVVTTKRCKEDAVPDVSYLSKSKVDETTESIIGRLATMSTSSPVPPTSRGSSRCSSPAVEIEYVSGRIKRLAPVPLPPPAIFFPPFSSDSSASDDDDDFASEDPDMDDDTSDEVTSRRANIHRSDDYPDGVDLSSGDEDGEDPEDESDAHRMYDNGARRQQMLTRRQSSAEAAAGTSVRGRSKSASAEAMMRTGGSSVATAGGVGSDISSSAGISS